jgi:hypothetical protein
MSSSDNPWRIACAMILIRSGVCRASALVIAWIARRIARKVPDEAFTFGYRRAELIAALINLTVLSVVGLYLIYESIMRFFDPAPILALWVMLAAGAALAKSYRLQNKKGSPRGTGIICLDEAFHGMDTENAVATAKFLQNLGLQLIMAGPELDRTKLAPVTQTIFDLDRQGCDLEMESTYLKPAGNKLMISDMPTGNPDVMANAYKQLGFEVPPEPDDLPGDAPDE